MKGKSAPIQVSVPIKPYLLKFIMYIEGLKEGQAFHLGRRSLVSDTLKRLFKYKKQCTTTSLRPGYTGSFPISIPPALWNQGCFYLDTQAVHDFNMAIFFFFHEMLEMRIMEGVRQGHKRIDIIEGYMELLGIEEDIEFETIKKGNFRLRTSRPNRIIPRKKSQNPTTKQSLAV